MRVTVAVKRPPAVAVAVAMAVAVARAVMLVTYPLYIRSIHTILCKIGHVIQIIPH